MEYFGLSKAFQYKKWRFDAGANTFVEAYSQRSYDLFINIAHADFRYSYFTPMLGLNCAYKGVKNGTNNMGVFCFPMPKLRIGKDSGLFALISAIPLFPPYTNGYAALELGYAW
ncbi:hypothetical protein [uncultured Thiodictyon sp.]|uniref:hypothetical protein n=1 Tax=uncultured Thiodictyon sp. TaxID=1846217 RepID=UPI0025E81BFB|nr:hypothetical protein [uncultured Thiodictyon sp.]